MKKLLITAIAAVLLAPVAAQAQSARSLECMAKNGFTPEQWRARSVPGGRRSRARRGARRRHRGGAAAGAGGGQGARQEDAVPDRAQ